MWKKIHIICHSENQNQNLIVIEINRRKVLESKRVKIAKIEIVNTDIGVRVIDRYSAVPNNIVFFRPPLHRSLLGHPRLLIFEKIFLRNIIFSHQLANF